MGTQELSNQFDVLLNSYAVAGGFGKTDSLATIELDEYEKSLFITNAQEELVLSLYTGRNSSLQGFEETEELRRFLSPLIREAELSATVPTESKPIGMGSDSKFFVLPDDLWFITYESVLITNGRCEGTTSLEVVPVRQDEYHKLKKNPFRGVNDRRALRLDLSDNVVEIISKYNITKYYVRYLRQLKPVILIDLEEGLELRGETEAMTSMLPESLHLRILNRAVEMALQSRGYIKNNRE